MKLGQINDNGRLTAAIIEGNQARPIPGHSMVELIHAAEQADQPLAAFAQARAGQPIPAPTLAIPISPVEVWACGCTYQRSAAFRDSEHNTREGFYAYVYSAQHRPEVFFKGTARVCVGSGEPIGLRPDSQFTAPEPELALVLGCRGSILGFTLANDVSAWDIERENPLYLPQSKTFTACCSLGPVIVTPDEIGDPYELEMTCTITRNGRELFSGSTSTRNLNRKFQVLLEYLYRGNAVPSGSVFMTGTGIIVTEESALHPGDEVTITVPQIGTLRNAAAVI